MRRPELENYVARELVPGDSLGDGDGEILNWARANLSSGLYGTGTCRIGSPDDSAVSPRLAVHGVEGLRVADCSVMPTAISGNTNGPAMAVGYRAAELILEEGTEKVPIFSGRTDRQLDRQLRKPCLPRNGQL